MKNRDIFFVYDFIREPNVKLYCDLLDYSLKFCCLATLVIRKDLKTSPNVDIILKKLEPYLIEIKDTKEWPGTVLYSDTAKLYKFNLNKISNEIFKNSTNGLYGWIQPHAPEDLCLLRKDEKPFLVTISHEKDAYLQVTDIELNELFNCIPGIRACLRKNGIAK